jgi:hypothetical protein
MQDGIVASKPAEQLAYAAERAFDDGAVLSGRNFGARRELLGIVGHHCEISIPLCCVFMTPLATRPFPPAGLMNIKRCATHDASKWIIR